MKTDLYTKIVLTVIAVVLTVNLLKSSITPAMADSKKYAAVPVNADGSINVKLIKGNSTIDVNIESIEGSAFNYVEPLEVKIKQ